MKCIHDSTQIVCQNKSVVVLGNFDGVHIGHQKLLEKAREEAQNKDLEVVVFSFYPPPTWILSTKKKELISSRKDKAELMKRYGANTFIEYPFDIGFSTITPEEFVENILIKELKAKCVIVGSNYHFGKGRKGDCEYLKDIANKNDIDVNIVDTVKIEGQVVSSSVIRELIDEGDIPLVNKMLGRNYSVSGNVVHGKKLGRTIGFPTANLETDNDRIYPPNGVYATRVMINNKYYIGITNIGMNPTVCGKNKMIETNIFDFNDDIYNIDIHIEFYRHIRKEKKFNSLNELKRQILEDSQKVAAFFNKQTNLFANMD